MTLPALALPRSMLARLAITAGSAVAAVASASEAVPTATALRELAGLKEEVVLEGAVVNGNRLDVNRFVDARSAQALQSAVRVVWSRRQAPIHRSLRDGWLVMTQVAGSSVETLEVRPLGSGAEGRWSRLRRGDGGLADASAWLQDALPTGSRLLDSVTHQDAGREMTTVVAMTDVSAAAALHGVASALARRGFESGSRAAPSFAAEGLAFFMARGTEDVAVTISELSGQRAVVMHWGRAVR